MFDPTCPTCGNPPETCTDPVWHDDNVQFARLLAEIRAAGLPTKTYKALMLSMDLTRNQIDDLLERAELEWEKIKGNVPDTMTMAEFRGEE